MISLLLVSRFHINLFAVFVQANLIVGDISEQISPVPRRLPSGTLFVVMIYAYRSNTKTTMVLLWK